MPLHRIASGFKGAAARFPRAERGNVAILYALSLPVLLTFIGAAIDYSRVANARSAMQAAIDATALMVSKEAPTLSADEINTKAQDYFKALYDHPEVGSLEIKAVYSPNTGNGASVKVDVSGTMPTDFMKYAGYQDMGLGASSTTRWGNRRYRVALALDNTGSMASASKMDELKKAANKLIDNFAAMTNTDADIYVSIVPFSKDVNVGTSNRAAPWVRWTEWEEANGDCKNGDGNTKKACDRDGGKWTPDKRSTWNGCVMDRDQSWDTTSDGLSNSPTYLMAPAEQYGSCPVSILGMTPVKNQKKTLTDKVAAMKPVGNTNQSIGAFWAWMTLQESGPFTAPAKDPNYSYQDVLILLTDGLNTQNRWDNCGGGWWGCAAVDKRQELLCDNLKQTNTMVFAIQVATDNDPVSTVTKECASKSDYFHYITKASQMTVTFENVFKELAKLRVAS